MLGLEHERHALVERGDDVLEQFGVAVRLEQHDIRQAADHHPLAQRNGEGLVVVHVRVGLQERLGIGIGLGGLVGDPAYFLFTQATRADQGDKFGNLVFH
ncbi:hypothetical protein D9M73_205890 [compost metagenome]